MTLFELKTKIWLPLPSRDIDVQFKKCSKRIQHVFYRVWRLFQHQFPWKKISIKPPISVQIMSYLGASDWPIKKVSELFLQCSCCDWLSYWQVFVNSKRWSSHSFSATSYFYYPKSWRSTSYPSYILKIF